MDFYTWVVIVAGFGMAIGAMVPAIGQAMAVKTALEGVSRNPGASGKILTTMMIGVAMIESLAIYVFVVVMILLFANPFKDVVLQLLTK
ncbi:MULTISPECIES: ATP synthase subunit c family protein [Syntrophotalea]|jgi:F-type H+-transporting ATPase subunit c|uniref:ATP synthase subunit c n=1 Tax=Syntrophotalea acetylenica TaxID=29542 RepID=A0A1L3GHD2_SYNAC|nr:F0F1 ATP synthase subunit C [Syntrophotalea acetylenica]APG25310.1 F0F1 ATP synthase subunit C [Syntrophotalea acetylenica]APG43379.1 F0F1 ATP synthase subunit C [Syntrophotalea acetylenica]MDY0263063.1 F0F1 ATP synthase subunit C [Syntrophotalea acetylenica]